MISAGTELLMAGLRRFVDPRSPELQPEPLQNADWDALLHAAAGQRVLAPLALCLKDSPAAARLPEGLRRRLREIVLSAGRENTLKLQEFETLRRLLESEGIALMPLKGVALTQTVYAERPVRSMGDVDILIRPQDLPRARRRLLEAGADPCLGANRWQDSLISLGRQSFFYRGTHLDLHWLLRFRICSRFVELDCSRAFRRAQGPVWGSNAYLLSPEDSAAVLLLHAGMDLERRTSFLGQLLDLALTIRHFALDREDILGRIDFPAPEPRESVERLLDLVHELWSEGRGPHGLSRESAELWRRLMERRDSAEETLGLTDIQAIPSWRNRLIFLAGYLFPDPEYVRRNFGEGARSRFRGHAHHWKRLVSKGLRVLASR